MNHNKYFDLLFESQILKLEPKHIRVLAPFWREDSSKTNHPLDIYYISENQKDYYGHTYKHPIVSIFDTDHKKAPLAQYFVENLADMLDGGFIWEGDTGWFLSSEKQKEIVKWATHIDNKMHPAQTNIFENKSVYVTINKQENMNHNKYIDLLLEKYGLKWFGTVDEHDINFFMDFPMIFKKDDDTEVNKMVRVIYIPKSVVPSDKKKDEWTQPAVAFYFKGDYRNVLNAFTLSQFMAKKTPADISTNTGENFSSLLSIKMIDKIKKWLANIPKDVIQKGQQMVLSFESTTFAQQYHVHEKNVNLMEEKILTAKVKNIKPDTNAPMYTSEPQGSTISFTNEMTRYIGKEIKVRLTDSYPDWYRIVKPTGYAFYFHKSWLEFHPQQQQQKLEF